jgi:hypothetical protein
MTMGLTVVLVLAAANLLLKGNGRSPWVLADSYTHFYVADTFRRARSWRVRLDRFLYDAAVPNHLDYPPLFGTLLAFLLGAGLPARRAQIARWLPPVFDSASLLTAVACTYWLQSGTPAPFVAAFIWVFSPCTHAQTIALSGRPLGALLATITFTALAKFVVVGMPMAALVTVVSGALLFLANRLAIQAWGLLTVAFAVAWHSLAPVSLLAGALLVASALTAGEAWRVHRGHWRHMRRLRHLMPKKGWHQLARFSGRRDTPPRSRQTRILLRVVALIDLPFVWVFVVALPGTVTGLRADPVAWACTLWLGTLLVCGTVIQAVPSLRFIGEGFRYFEFAIVPLALLVARAAVLAGPGTRLTMGLAAAVATGVGLMQIQRAIRASFLEGTRRDERAVMLTERLRAQNVDRLLVVPLQYASMLVVEADKTVLMMLNEVASDLSDDFYPVMERPPMAYVNEFAIGGVWLDRRYVEADELGLADLTLVDEEGPFACYALPMREPVRHSDNG